MVEYHQNKWNFRCFRVGASILDQPMKSSSNGGSPTSDTSPAKGHGPHKELNGKMLQVAPPAEAHPLDG